LVACGAALPKEVLAEFLAEVGDAEEHLRQADDLIAEGSYSAAEKQCEVAMAVGPHIGVNPYGPSLLKLGDVHSAEGNYRDALAEYLGGGRTTARDGLDLDIALCYFRLGNYSQAGRADAAGIVRRLHDGMKDIDREVGGPGDNKSLEGYILYAKALILSHHVQETQAVKLFAQAQALLPGHALLAYDQARSLAYLHRYAEAAAQMAIATKFAGPRLQEQMRGQAAAISAALSGATKVADQGAALAK
jgi:tetratricopeptide (TPR) repeat protein